MASDVLIIGGGVIGLSVARECAMRGASVTLIADGVPGASMVAAGMLCPGFESMQTGGRSLAAMGRESLKLWDEFATAICDDDPADEIGYERSGTIGVGYPVGALRGSPAPVPPGIEASACVLIPEEGQVDPRLLIRALGRSCEAAGVDIVSARAAELGDGQVRLTDGEIFEADRIVIASGATRFLPELPITAVRGRAFLVRNEIGLERVVRSPSVYFAPKSGDTLYIGATEEEHGLTRDGAAALDGLRSEALWLAPGLRSAEVLKRFDGLRPCLPNELPMIEPHPEREGVFLAVGHHRNGVLLAPLTAKLVADGLEGRHAS